MKAYKKKKEELIFLKEINSLFINAKDFEKEYLILKNKNNGEQKEENKNNILLDKKRALEREKRKLKYILNDLEINYGLNSQQDEEFINKLNSKQNGNINEEISNNIIGLYSSKKFNLCYNLWRKYDFQMLLGISEERNFDMLNYLNKLRDRYETRNDIINKIKEINSSDAHKINDNSYSMNQKQSYYSKINSPNIDNSQNYSQISNNLLYNQKLSENEKMLQTLKNQLNILKSNSNKK